jgi:hypothetical protein
MQLFYCLRSGLIRQTQLLISSSNRIQKIKQLRLRSLRLLIRQSTVITIAFSRQLSAFSLSGLIVESRCCEYFLEVIASLFYFFQKCK